MSGKPQQRQEPQEPEPEFRHQHHSKTQNLKTDTKGISLGSRSRATNGVLHCPLVKGDMTLVASGAPANPKDVPGTLNKKESKLSRVVN